MVILFTQIDSVYISYVSKLYTSNIQDVKLAYDFFRKMANSRSNKYDLYFYAYSIQILYFSTKEYNKEKYLDDAIKSLEKAIKIDKNFADGYALLSGFYGIKAGMNIFYGMFYGPKSSQTIKKALEIDSQNPRVRYAYAQSLIYTPESFGGNFDSGVNELKKIIVMYENGYKGKDIINWGYKESILSLAMAYEMKKKYSDALVYYKKLLEIEPKNEFYKIKVKEMEGKL